MMKINTIHARDIIAALVLAGCGYLLYSGKDGVVSAVAAAIIGYYFSKRVYEEQNNKVN